MTLNYHLKWMVQYTTPWSNNNWLLNHTNLDPQTYHNLPKGVRNPLQKLQCKLQLNHCRKMLDLNRLLIGVVLNDSNWDFCPHYVIMPQTHMQAPMTVSWTQDHIVYCASLVSYWCTYTTSCNAIILKREDKIIPEGFESISAKFWRIPFENSHLFGHRHKTTPTIVIKIEILLLCI